MAKRFCDTEIFKKKWFRALPIKYKTFFFYLFTNCDVAGVWEVDFEQVSFFVDKSIDENKSLQLFEKHIIVIDNGKKWFLKDFIPFQYGDHLNEKSPVHKKIIDILSKYTIDGDSLYNTLYNRVLDTAKEEEKDKEEEKEKDKQAALKNIKPRKEKYVPPTGDKLKERIEQLKKDYAAEISKYQLDPAIDNYKAMLSHLFGKNQSKRVYKNILSMRDQITFPEFKTMEEVSVETGISSVEIFDEMENRADLPITNLSISGTAINWMRRNNKRKSA